MTVHIFRKRPVEVQAVQWTGGNEAKLVEFTGHRFEFVDPDDRTDDPDITAQVLDITHSTWVGVKTGQWIIRGVKGEFYPIDQEILAETYDRVDTAAPTVFAEPDYLPGYPGKLARPPAGLLERSQREAVTPERIAAYYLDHCGNCRDAEFYGAAGRFARELHAKHVQVIEDGHGPLAGQPCACKTCVTAVSGGAG